MALRLKNQFICSGCQATYPLNEPRWRCDCGHFLDIEFEAKLKAKTIQKRTPSLWRYREAIPLSNDENIVTFREGFTPLVEIPILKKPVFFKLDYLFQTGSFKDRGATVLISKLKEMDVMEVVEDSSGNAGTAIAAYCAKSGIKCQIFVPAATSPGKLNQIISYGADLKKIPGPRDQAAEAALKAAENLYYASHSWNPFFLQGTKTFSYEVCEQLYWQAPDILFLPVGNGTLLLGAYIGFVDLIRNGIIKRIPRLVAVQSKNCAPLHEMFFGNPKRKTPGRPPKTMAEGIAVKKPVRAKQIIDAVNSTGGTFLTVDERDIYISMNEMSRKGYHIEPTSAVVVAGIQKYLENNKTGGIMVSALTGHGLKHAADKSQTYSPLENSGIFNEKVVPT